MKAPRLVPRRVLPRAPPLPAVPVSFVWDEAQPRA